MNEDIEAKARELFGSLLPSFDDTSRALDFARWLGERWAKKISDYDEDDLWGKRFADIILGDLK